jgi:hypothetical protein
MPLPWKPTILALLPGVAATLGLIRSDYSEWMFFGALLLLAFVAGAYIGNNKQLPDWSLLAAGILSAQGLSFVAGMIGGLAALIVGASNQELVMVILLAAFVILWAPRRQPPLPGYANLFVVLIILCHLIVRLKYFGLYGFSQEVALQWFSISMYAALNALLLPIAITRLFAPLHGHFAILFMLGMFYGNFQLLIDVNNVVSGVLENTIWMNLYRLLIPFLLTLGAPLWLVRTASASRRRVGLLTIIGLALVINFGVVGWSYQGALPLGIWLSFIPYTLGVLLAFILADKFCQPNAIEKITPTVKP